MSLAELDDNAVAERVAARAARLNPQLIELSVDIRELIRAAVPEVSTDEQIVTLLEASIRENVDCVIHILLNGMQTDLITAPNAALEYGRRLAQRDVPVAMLIRAYRIGQARFLHRCLADALELEEADHLEGAATLRIVEQVFDYIDRVVEQVVAAYELARDEWVHNRGAVIASRVLSLLTERNADGRAAESRLGGYRIGQRHVGAVIWADDLLADVSTLTMLRRLTDRVAQKAACRERPLFVPRDDLTAWVWIPIDTQTDVRSSFAGVLAEGPSSVFAALGECAPSLDGFRRTHQQAIAAQAVALAAGDHRARLTQFVEVAPLTTMCADLQSARAWVAETLGALAIDDRRHDLLRETARVFLASGGSYIATADQLMLHRNTAQYRIRKAEELRGRPLQERRLDVELALLACHWLGRAVLQPVR